MMPGSVAGAVSIATKASRGSYDAAVRWAVVLPMVVALGAPGAVPETATGLRYGTFIGGPGGEAPVDVAIGDDGSTYVTGQTGGDAFVAKFDPTASELIWMRVVGGSETEYPAAIAVGAGVDPPVYLAGYTYSDDFPTTEGSYRPRFNGGCCDGFVTKLSGDGERLLFSTFLGGSSFEAIRGMAVGPDRTVHVTGETLSPNFPTTRNALSQDLNQGGSHLYSDAFVAAIAADGATLAHSTFLGGRSNDGADAIALTAAGTELVGGTTQSVEFPTTPGAFDTTFDGGPSGDGFLVEVGRNATAVRFGTYLGGGDSDDVHAITTGPTGGIVVAGSTSSPDFPTTPGAYDETINSHIFSDAFVVELDERGSALAYGTFIGGDDTDIAQDVAVDATGAAFVTGTTFGTFPTTPGAWDRTPGGPGDAFVARLDAGGAQLGYSTYLGGDGSVVDFGDGVARVGAGDDVVVTGRTFSPDFPVTPGAYDTTYNGGFDGFLVRLRADA
jgi:hypothetical protein